MDETLGARIERLRKHRELGQKELGRRVGLSESAVSNLENGKVADLKLPVAMKMAAVFGITVEELHSGLPPLSDEAVTAERLALARVYLAAIPASDVLALEALPDMPERMTDPATIARIIAHVENKPGRDHQERLARQRARREPVAYVTLCVNLQRVWGTNFDVGLAGYEALDTGT